MSNRGKAKRGARHSNGPKQHGGQGRVRDTEEAFDTAEEDIDNGNASDNEETWICRTCKADYGKVKNGCFLECAICAAISCNICVAMTEDQYKAIDSRDDVQWFCSTCIKDYFPDGPTGSMKMNKSDTLLHNKIEELGSSMEEQNNQLKFSVATMKAQLSALEAKFQESLQTLEEEVPTKIQEKLEATNTWAAMAKKMQEETAPQISIESVKKAVHEVTEKDKEMHMRDRGVVIYRIPEKSNIAQEQRKKDDEEFVKEILHYINCDDLARDITHLERLGRFDEGKASQEKYRPIKLRFNLKDQRDRMLNNLTGLKHAPERIKKVSIRHDLNDAQRQDWYNKIKEAKEKTQESTTHIFRVRGHPGNYNILSFPKNMSRPST